MRKPDYMNVKVLPPIESRDPRYELILPMYEAGKIKSFPDIFKYIPKTVVAKDIGMKVDRFNELLLEPDGFIIRQIYAIAHLVNLDEGILSMLIYKHHRAIRDAKIERQKNIDG